MPIGLGQKPELPLERCPQCSVARPRLSKVWSHDTKNHAGLNHRRWAAYVCATCGGVVLAESRNNVAEGYIDNLYPAESEVPTDIPERARHYLSQAIASQHAPAGAIMLTASAVDAMLKHKGFTAGSLSSRIDSARDKHLITPEMALWAHDVRLDANDQRHSDNSADLPTTADARRSIDFALALAEFLFVLPARVASGRSRSDSDSNPA